MLQSCVTKKSLPQPIEPVDVTSDPATNTALVIFDEEYRYAHIDSSWAEMNGITVAEVLGKRIGEVLPQLATLVEPMLQKVLLLGQPILGHALTPHHKPASGLNQNWLISYYPLLATNGRAIGIISIMSSYSS